MNILADDRSPSEKCSAVCGLAAVNRNFRALFAALSLAVALFLAWPIAASRAQEQTQAAPPRATERIVGITLKGSITRASVAKIRAAAALASAYAVPTPLMVFLDSPGGDGLAAMEIGRVLRLAKAHVFVNGRCASACILVLAGGVNRSAHANAVGIHRGRLTEKRDGKIADVAMENNDKARAILSSAEEKAEEYFSEMGLPHSVFEAMQAVAPNQVRWLNSDDALKLGLVGFDESYLASYSKDILSRYRVSTVDLVRRSNNVLTHCEEHVREHSAFIACYKQQILSPEETPLSDAVPASKAAALTPGS
jgi:hypothetical protein